MMKISTYHDENKSRPMMMKISTYHDENLDMKISIYDD